MIYPIGRSIAALPTIKANSPRNTRDHLVSPEEGNGDPMHEVCMYVYHAHRKYKREVRGRSRYKKHKRVIRNLDVRNVGTIRVKNPKQGLISSKDLTIQLSLGHDSPLPYRLD